MSDIPQTSTTEGATSAQQAAQAVEKPWGRVLLCGGTNWSKLGKKEKPGTKDENADERPDLLEPHYLRSLANIKAVSIHASSSSCHCIVIDVDGNAWMFGRNQPPAMGSPSNEFQEVSECAPRKLTPTGLGAPYGTKFIHAACGRGHSLLVGSNGDMWSAGGNVNGQCGHTPCPEISSFTLIRGPILAGKKQKVIQVGAGISFSLCLTDDGKVWSFGSAENGQLGNGKTGEHIATGNKIAFDIHSDPGLVRGIESNNIISIACGNQHSILLDDKGFVYTFGYNGYCRLGLGDQVNRLKATVVPQFATPERPLLHGRKVYAGPSCSVVVNKQDMFWLAGKFKNTGDGSSGQPWTTFKVAQDIMSCKIDHVALGGVTLWALSQNDDGTPLTIGWGQNAANGELGLGPDEIKSAVKPIDVVPFRGLKVIDIAAGQNTSYFIAQPNDKLSDLPRHPDDVDHNEDCVVCDKDEPDNSPLVCEKCDNPYHLKCLTPPLAAIPEGEWFCPVCTEHPGAPLFAAGQDPKSYLAEPTPKRSRGRPKKDAEEEATEDAVTGKGTKRKASATGTQAVPKKKK